MDEVAISHLRLRKVKYLVQSHTDSKQPSQGFEQRFVWFPSWCS